MKKIILLFVAALLTECCLLSSVLKAQLISAGGDHSVFLCSDKSAKACGWNYGGELGNGNDTNKSTPVQVLAGASGCGVDLCNIKAVCAGGAGSLHSIFLKSDSTVWSCGYNPFGQLGNGNDTDQYTPVRVIGLTGITALGGGGGFSLFLKSDSTAWGCGNNIVGEIGDDSTTNQYIADQVKGLTGLIAVSGGADHSLFLKSDGTVWACGNNTNGELGIGAADVNNHPLAVQIPGLSKIVAIAAGGNHSLFLKNDGTVWSCGDNSLGELGDGTSTERDAPVQVHGLPFITSISAGYWISLFLDNTGTVWACGNNGNGQLGNGNTMNQATPVQVSGLTGITAISAGNYHSLFLKNDATVWACGANGNGQLGDGTNTDRHSPVQVMGLCTVTVTPVASFQVNNSSICAYNCVNFTDFSTDATSWQWSFPGGSPSSSSAQNPEGICYLDSGNFAVTLVVSNGFVNDTATIVNYMKVIPSPAAPLITQVHNDTLFCSTDTSYTGYQWYDDSTLITNATDTFLVITHGGNYNIKVTGKNGCTTGTGITVLYVGIEPVAGAFYNGISLWPNPARDELMINGYLPKENSVLRIYNTLGQQVEEEKISEGDNISVNIKFMPAGIYFVKLVNNDVEWIGKFIKE